MATPSNTKLNRTGGEESGSRTDTAKENYHAIKLSNPDGSIAFSRIHKRADVTAAVMLETADSEHAFFLDKDGTRKGTTTSISPQRFSVECGKTMKEALNKSYKSIDKINFERKTFRGDIGFDL